MPQAMPSGAAVNGTLQHRVKAGAQKRRKLFIDRRTQKMPF